MSTTTQAFDRLIAELAVCGGEFHQIIDHMARCGGTDASIDRSLRSVLASALPGVAKRWDDSTLDVVSEVVAEVSRLMREDIFLVAPERPSRRHQPSRRPGRRP